MSETITSWEYSRTLTSKAEAGINRDKNDTGNQVSIDGKTYYTNTYYGITFEAWTRFNNIKTPDNAEDFDKLKLKFDKEFYDDGKVSEDSGKEKVDLLFKKNYWDKHNLGKIKDKRVAASIYDAIVNQGFSFGDKGRKNTSMLNALKRLGIDTSKGFTGLEDAINQVNAAIDSPRVGAEKLLNSYAQEREESYIKSSQNPNKPKNVTYSRGWMKRLNDHRTDGIVDWQKLEVNKPLTRDSIANVRVDTPKIKDTPQPKENIMEGFDMDPETITQDQTQQVQPVIPEAGPSVSDVASVDDLLNAIKEEKIKEREKEEKKRQEVYEEEVVEEEVAEEDDEDIKAEIKRREAEEAEKERLEEEKYFKEQEEKKEQERRDKRVIEGGELPEITIEGETPIGLTPKTTTIPREETELFEGIGKQKIVIDNKEEEEQRRLENIGVEQTQDIEVIDSNGNINTITTPVVETQEFPGLLPEVTVTDQSGVESEVEEEVDELVKPQMKDFRSSSEYMKARRKYYQQIEEPEDYIEDELTDDEIIEHVDRERSKTPINSAARNIFNTSSGNNIFNTIIGEVDDLLEGISNSVQVKGSLISESDEDEITTVTGGFGPSGMTRTETTTTRGALKAQREYEKSQDLGELNITDATMLGEEQTVPSEIEKRISAEEQEALDLMSEFEKEKKEKIIKDSKLTGNFYNERQSILSDMDIGINKSTIETLALKNPDDLNIENGVVTDNAGNIIETKEDWINFASKPEEKGGLGFRNADEIYNLTSDQFKSGEYKYMKNINKQIDGAWDYFKTSVATETGILPKDVMGWFGIGSENETIDLGKYENEIKKEFLNGIDLGDITKYYNEEKSAFTRLPIIESMSLKEKERRIEAAKYVVLERQMKILNKAGGDITLLDDGLKKQEKNLVDGYEEWLRLQETTQNDLNILEEKHGTWSYDQSGKRVYVPYIDKSRWPQGDKLSLKSINESIRQIENDRIDLNNDRKKYFKDKESRNKIAKDFNAQREELLMQFGWNGTTMMFDPAFKQTEINKKYRESLREIPWIGRPLDVIATTVEGYYKLLLAGKAVTGGAALATNPAAWSAAVVGYITEKSGTLDYFYEFGPSKKSEVNKGYTHAGQLWDGILQIWGKEWAPISEDPEGEWMVKGYESDKETLVGRWLDNVAGGGSNMNLYSGAKGLGRLAGYIKHISMAGKGLVSKAGGPGEKLLKQREAVGKFAGTTKDLLAAAGQVKLGRSIAASMQKSFLTSQRFTGILEMNKINYRITLLDNIADGRARGLSHAEAFTYGNALSFVTGLTQSIMPDYLYFRGKNGGLYKEFASNLVKGLTGKTMNKIAHQEALKRSTSQFFSSLGKEYIEEYLDVGGHDLVKSFYIAGHSPEIAKVEVNAEVFRATTMMTIPLAGMGSVATHRNTKATVYNHFYRNATETINYGNKTITALDNKLKNLTNSKKDRALKKILEAEKKVVETQLAASEDIRRAINVAPDMVTDTQLDLLIQKGKLLDEKAKLKNKDKVANKDRFQELTDEIAKIDEKIEEHSIGNYQETLYDRLYENSLALAKKMGWTIEHVDIDTSTKEGKQEYFKYIEIQQKKRRKQNADIDKQIEEIKKEHKGKTLSEEAQAQIDKLESRKRAIPPYDSPGFIDYDDTTGRHHIIIDKSQAMAGYDKNSAVMLHELLHAALRQTVRNNPNAVKGMAWMLREELINNPERYNVPGFTGAEMSVVGKFDAYKKEVGNMAFDEMFSIITESIAQGNIKIETGLLSKISDFIRRTLREIGVNFQIEEPSEMINFLRDFNHEVLSGRKSWSRGMRKIIKDGRTSAIGGRPLIKVSQDAINKAKDTEKNLLKLGEIKEIWNPQYAGAALSLGGKVGRINVYDQQQIKRDLKLSENTKKIVEENERLRKLILEEGIKDGKKIVASEDLQTKIVENNLPMAIGLARFAANNPKIMGLEEGKRVTYEQFLSGYYLQLSNLARTYDASVNEFGQYLNTILPLRYGEILEAEKKGAMEGAKGLDFIPDIPVDPDDDVDITPDEVSVGPKVDTAKRFQIKDKTKPFIDKGLAQIRKLQDLQVKISEKYNEKTAEEIAEITASLESKGMIDLDIESLTVKKAPNLLYKFVAKEFGIDEDKLNPNSTKWLANLRKDDKRGSNEVRAAQRAVAKNPEVILSTVFNEGHTAAFKSSGMPRTLLRFGYNKGSKRINNNFPQYKKPNLSETDLLKFVGIEKVTRKGITGYKFTVDRNTGTKLLAIAQMVDRNMSLQAINEHLVETGDMTAKIKNSIEDGLANASKSIYYRNNVELQPVIRERLPLLGFKLQNVDDNWTTKQIKDVIMEVYKGTGVKAAFANDLLKKTAVINKYKLLKRSSIARKETPISLDEFLEQEFANIDIFEGVMAMLGISVDRKEDLYTKDNIKSVRKQVGDFAFMVDKLEEENQKKIKEIDSSTKEGKKEIARLKREAMELLFLFEQQHITAAKMGNGLYQAVAGTNDLVLKNKVGKQRDQVFGSEDGAPTDFRLFVNQRMNNLQMPLNTKEANKIKKDLGISPLFVQKSKAVIERLMKGTFDFKGRTAEAIIARKLVKMQMKFYAKLYKKGEITNEHYMMHMLTFGSSMSTVSRRAASLYGIQEGILSNGIDGKYIYGKIKNAGQELEYEHGKPHGHLILELNQIVLNEKESSWDTMMDEVFIDYKVNIITKRFDDVLTLSGVKDRMVPTGQIYEKGKEHGWEQRLYSKLTLGHPDVKPIISLDGKKTKHGQSFSKSINVLPKSVAEINVDKKISKGIESARSINYTNKTKGITVLDFDDTLATSKSQVISTSPEGVIRKLTAEEFAKEGADLLGQGWTHDFSEFNKVVDGKVASLFKKALKLQRKFGPKNMFVLTARPAESALSIFEFLKANGLNIPLENITGLANSTSEAKALWMAEKVGEGYNDFYFADDALQNVQAVQNMLDQFDVKSKVQQAKVSFSIDYDSRFNKILEESKGVDAEKRFSKAKAQMRGAEKGKYQIFIPPSAEDFVGLIYYFLGKGKQGEKQFDFFKKTLIDPLNRAYRSLNSARQAIADDYKKLQKQFPEIRKNLYKKLPGTEFTYGDAIRVYLWDKAGFNIPGLSPTDQKKLASMVNNDPDLKTYAETLSVISRAEDGYIEPNDNWLVEDIRVDLMNGMAKIHRKKFFAEFLENVKIIFSEQNLNKIEAIYGSNFVEALRDILYRIENGTNRSFGSNRLVNRFMNWINGSIGTTMFFNSRSAVLQTLSTVNFINWSDNNVIAAAKAFANQKQFWADFSMIFNSTFLKQRRAGLTLDLNANEIANYVSNSKSPIKSALNYLLQKGFLPTQIADSFAIAMGGATFYRNRVNKYLVEGMTKKEAEEQAFLDMQDIAEETQQSARPDRISQQQASVLGRIILAFQNTPMQYTRLMKKAILDLKDGRGDVKTNISKIIYYGAIQNIIFYSLQTALFAMMFGDDDDEEFFDKKKERVLNGTLDSTLRGMGVGGAVVSTVKNMILKFLEEQDKPRYRKNENAVLLELLNLSPPIGIKARQIQMGTRTLNWNQDTIEEIPLYNLDNPIWEAGFNYTQALTNVPVARMHTKVTNLREAANKENEAWQRIAILMGWSKWNLGAKSKKTKKTGKKKRKQLILR